MAHALLPLALAALLAAPLLAGCLTQVEEPLGPEGAPPLTGYDTSRGWSMPLSPALYGILESVKEKVPSFDGTPLALGIFLPDMPGCDWTATELPEECRLPTVMDAGPYYGANVDKDKYRPPTIEWLVPRGYAVIQMSLRGTGESGGCLGFKDPKDVEDVSAVIDWIAAQAWSNGNVGMTGRSYDGTSAWAGAASGNPHLKTIVPISGAVNGPGLYYKNGTSELRGFINGGTYFPTYATDAKPPQEWTERLCKEALVDVHAESSKSALTGDASSPYWQSRDLRGRILENYKGSVWVIHGLQDWNVNPSQAVPFIQEMQDAGIDVKAWLGVWGHHYPDRVDEHRNVRWDWAEKTVQWFDKYLKNRTDVDTGPAVEVEDSLFVWRGESSYPPRDLRWEPVDFKVNGFGVVAANRPISVTGDVLEEPLRIAGLPRFHVQATPTTAAPTHLFAELYDVWPDGRSVRIGWGAINLAYADGGNTQPKPVLPGQAVLAKMEFEPVDALVAKGHRLRLVVHLEGVEDIVRSPSPAPVRIDWAGTELSLPVIERGQLLPVYVPPGLPADG